MEYTELADYPVPAGTVTEWTPAAPAAAWRDDPRRPCPNHADHLRANASHPVDAARPGEWIGSIWRIPERFDADAMRRTLHAWFARHEVFRSQVVVDAAGGFTRRTVAAEAVTFSTHRVPAVLSGHRVYQHLKDFFDATITPVAWPHILVATVEHAEPEAGFTVMFGADHSVMDAYTQMFTIAELSALYHAEITGTPAELPPAGSYIDFAEDEHTAAGSIGADHPAVRAWQDFLAVDGGSMPRVPLPLAAGDGSPVNRRMVQSSLSTWLLDAEQTAALDKASKAAGGKLQHGVIAALALAQRAQAAADRTRFVMPMHTRNDLKWAASVGWFVGIMPVDITLPPRGENLADDFAAAVAAAKEGLARHRDVAQFPYPAVASAMAAEHADQRVPRYVVSYVDGRFIPGVENWGQWNARVLRSESRAGEELYLWIGRAKEGLNISTRFPSNPVAAESVYGLLAALRETLVDVAGVAIEV